MSKTLSHIKLNPFISIAIAVMLAGFSASSFAQDKYIVAQDGTGQFKTIQEAIDALPEQATAYRTIQIKKGIYKEKLFISKNFIRLSGEDKSTVQIISSQSRDSWRCDHPDDWGVATINLRGDDIFLENLTISNNYGFENKEPVSITCAADTGSKIRSVRRDGHQMALRSFGTTRMIVVNCVFKAFGGDTVSPWNDTAGMYYFKDCRMEGGVDFYCPRGWAYAEGCEFFAYTGTAAVWHDGSKNKSSKTVFRNCTFSGYKGFKLARYHRDAQFFFVDCSFSADMSDTDVYLVPTSNNIQWGRRVYFYNCHRSGGDFTWHSNNLTTYDASLQANDINVSWTFDRKWEPQQELPTDSIAENMLLYQRSIGGWPKAIGNIKVDYTKALSTVEKQVLIDDAGRNDATIDNQATTKEIKYLVKAYKKTKNSAYLSSAERGISYLLKAQYANGGWPQFYPDSSSYRNQVTFNDNAMINVLNVLQDIAEQKNGFDAVDKSLVEKSTQSVKKGIECILASQVKVKGKLTAWAAQYDKRTLKPAKARAFELVSLASAESVGIVEFLMRLPQPSDPIKKSIQAAVEWLDLVKIPGYKYVDVEDSNQPNGKDRVLVKQEGSIVWARFYDIDSNEPIFSGRDSVPKKTVAEIEHERRVGYAWYGQWAQKLLSEKYPDWKKKNS